MFGRRKATSQLASPTVVGGKGRATPKRSTSQAARKQPLVPTARKTSGRGASKATRAASRTERQRSRELMMSGDERYLQARDQGPVRRLARDLVDARWNFGEFLLPVMLVVVVVSFSGLQERAPQAAAYVFMLVYAMVVASGLDAFIVTRRLKKQVAQRFGPDAYVRGTSMYAVFRAFQLRRSRIPRPGVKRGEQPR